MRRILPYNCTKSSFHSFSMIFESNCNIPIFHVNITEYKEVALLISHFNESYFSFCLDFSAYTFHSLELLTDHCIFNTVNVLAIRQIVLKLCVC